MSFLDTSILLSNELKAEITLKTVFNDIQFNTDIKLSENAKPQGRRPLPVGSNSPFMFIGQEPTDFDLDDFFEDPELCKEIDNICNSLSLQKKDLYLTNMLEYPSDKDISHPYNKDAKEHSKQFLSKEVMIVEPEIIFLIGEWTQKAFASAFKI